MTRHMCGNVLDDCVLCSLCECVCAQRAFSLLKRRESELGSPILSTALLHVQLHSSSNREQNYAQFSLNKELLFPFCVYLHVCVATTTSYPWVFPLILSSRLIPYRKLITDWLGSCFPLISPGPAWGSLLRDWWSRDLEQKACCPAHVYVGFPNGEGSVMQMSDCRKLYEQLNRPPVLLFWDYNIFGSNTLP